MITKFEEGKRYRFSKEAFIKAGSEIRWDISKNWAKECLNKDVEVLNSYDGKIENWLISPEWCEEVTEEN